MVEAAEVFKDSNIRVLDGGTAVRLEKGGPYEFTAGPGAHVAVYDGQAEVDRGDQHIKLKKGKELDLGGPLRAHKFDRDQHDELYAWSSLRSEYSSEASLQSARTVIVNNGWSGPGMVLDHWLGHVCVSSGRRNSLQSIRLGFLLAVVGFLWTRLRYRIRVEIASIMAVVIGRVAGLFGAEARLAARGVGPPADSAVIQVVLAPEVSPVWAGGSEAVTEWVAPTGK